jgi:ABC-type multidrug transport system fused ATPase/permease subunit
MKKPISHHALLAVIFACISIIGIVMLGHVLSVTFLKQAFIWMINHLFVSFIVLAVVCFLGNFIYDIVRHGKNEH